MVRPLLLSTALLLACQPGMAPPPMPQAKPGADEATPAHVVLRRLGRREYNNTVRDLLHTRLSPADDFPEDDHGYGFDTIASVLTLSPTHLEMYLRAAERLAADATRRPPEQVQRVRFEAEDISHTTGGPYDNWAWNIWAPGDISTTLSTEHPGTYRLTARAFGHQAGPDLPQLLLAVDGNPVASFDVAAVEDSPGLFSMEFPLEGGLHTLSATFTNDYYKPLLGQDRNLIVDYLELEGPLGNPRNPARETLMLCEPDRHDPTACTDRILRTFVPRAWRRPITDDEHQRLSRLVQSALEQGTSFDEAIALMVTAVLVSPHFVFRVERYPASNAPEPLSDHELATRLSYFLWSSMPDDALFEVARSGTLHQPEVLRAEIQRMLFDPRASALIHNFFGQWLYLRALDNAAPDPWYYPDWDEELRTSMARETELFLTSFITQNRPLTDLLNASDTFLDPRLARHYNLPHPSSQPEHLSVDLSDTPRRGILSHGSLLTTLAYPTRPSITARGKWVMEQLLCDPPAPPPPDIPPLEDQVHKAGTLRERLAAHTQDPVCASCHVDMDAYGFGLARFDGIGAYNKLSGWSTIDASGHYPATQEPFDGAAELAAHIADDPRFLTCAIDKTFTYALGRPPGPGDASALEAMEHALRDEDMGFANLLTLVILSEPFRMRASE